MNKIINSLATAEFVRKLNAVEVNFKGSGSLAQYHETIDIALNISLVYQTNQWLLKKSHFQDISPDTFLNFIGKWSKKSCQLHLEHHASADCKVALYTTAETDIYLRSEHEGIGKHTSTTHGLTLRVFSDLEKAQTFLSQGKEPKVLI